MKVHGKELFLIRGDSTCIKVTLKDIGFTDNVDVIEFTVRKEPASEEKLIYNKITAFNDGAAVIAFENTDTEDIAFGDYVYDIQWTDEYGKVRTIIPCNTFSILEEVTY